MVNEGKALFGSLSFFQIDFQAFREDFLEPDYFKFGVALTRFQQFDIINYAKSSPTWTRPDLPLRILDLAFLFHNAFPFV